MNLILFGFKSCGKTYYGKLLAKALDKPFIDTDDLLFKLHGKSPRKLYQEVGEPAFRALETEIILNLLDTKNSVIALGGGAVLDQRNVQLLQAMGQLIFLDASLKTIISRNATLAAGPIDKVYTERLTHYHSIPAYHVSVDNLADDEVVASIKQKVSHAF